MIDYASGRLIAGVSTPLEWIEDDEASEFRSGNSKSSAYPLEFSSIMNSMNRNVADTRYKHIVATYEKFRPHYQSMTFQEVVSEFLENHPIESKSVEQRFEDKGSDVPSYFYPRHAAIQDPKTYLERLDSQMPVSVDWPPPLHCFPSFKLHTNTMTTTIGPLTGYVFIFMLSI